MMFDFAVLACCGILPLFKVSVNNGQAYGVTRKADCREGNMEDPKVISSTDLRVKTRDIIESAKFKGQHYIVQTFGKPMAAIIGIDEYNTLTRLLKEQSLSMAAQQDSDI